MYKIVYKVPEGKLLKINLELDEMKQIVAFELRGDFFLYPEDGFLEIEKFMLNQELNDTLFEQLHDFIEQEGFEIYGFTAHAIKDAIYSFLEKYED